MAGSENSEKAVLRLKLLVDKKKNKVVLVEAGKEFVDVLFSFLTLPMGTVVRLIEKYQKNQASEAIKIGCFNNLYKSVFDIDTDIFMTKACKDMLLCPRSVNENQRKRLKLNIDDTETLKYYTCQKKDHGLDCNYYSNFCSLKCFCGEPMTVEFKFDGGVEDEEIFFSNKSLFTITDDLKVGFTSISLTMKSLKMSGYSNVDELHEIHVDVDHEKLLGLLQCLFSSNTPFTDVFLTTKRSRGIPKVLNMPNLGVQEESGGVAQLNTVMSLSVFFRKWDNVVLYIETEKDFVELLFTFLVLPLNSAWTLAGSHLFLGCIDNLCESFKSLSCIEGRNALNNDSVLPWYYRCQQGLLDVLYGHRLFLTTIINSYTCKLAQMDPRGNGAGFVKRGTIFMVLDDLTVAPMDLSLTISSLKKWNLDLDDIEEQVINITKAEAVRLLRASFRTSNALNTVFRSLLLKKPKEEKS